MLTRIVLMLVLACGSAVFARPAMAQGEAEDAARPPDDLDGPALSVPEVEAARLQRAPLLREGSMLVEVRGTVRFDDESRRWRLDIKSGNEDANGRELTLLPCTLLGEVSAIVSASPDATMLFEMTGEVFVFQGENYLLATHPPRLVRHESASISPPPGDGTPTTMRDVPATELAGSPPDDSEDDSTEAILRKLDDESTPWVAPAVDRPGTSAGEEADSLRPPSTAAGGNAALRSDNLLREHTALVSKRGNLRRTGGGAWMFIQDADAAGLADPPMILMPCLLLERLEQYARRRGEYAPVQLTGEVYLFENRNYLLPTVFIVPRDSVNVMP